MHNVFRYLIVLVMAVLLMPGVSAQGAKRELPIVLKTAPELPYLPPYSGQMRGLRALDYPHPKAGGRMVSVNFECAETKDDVRNFYLSAFKQYGWQVNPGIKSDRYIQAQRGTTSCSVTFLEMAAGPRTKFITRVHVNYRAY